MNHDRRAFLGGIGTTLSVLVWGGAAHACRRRARPAHSGCPAWGTSKAGFDGDYYLRISRVTQGPDGFETPASARMIHYDDFLWIYVDARLPSGSPMGEYFQLVNGVPDLATRVALGPPTVVNGQYRFSVIHYTLSPATKYSFHFADSLTNSAYEDRWEIDTVQANTRERRR